MVHDFVAKEFLCSFFDLKKGLCRLYLYKETSFPSGTTQNEHTKKPRKAPRNEQLRAPKTKRVWINMS